MDTDTSVTEYSAEWWANEITTREKTLREKFWVSGDQIQQKFLGHSGTDGDGVSESLSADTKQYNLFWTNTLILKSALYAQPPTPLVKRMHDDANDDAARVASLILQRALDKDLQQQNSNTHNAFIQATEDRLIPGLGQVWARLETEVKEETITTGMMGEPLAEPIKIQKIVKQTAPLDYVHWKDFIWSASRTWEEVWWVARRVWLRKSQFIKRFSEEKWDELEEQRATVTSADLDKYPRGWAKGRVEVMEIWCLDTMKVYFVHVGAKMLCEEPKDDPLKLEDFFPCPRPLLATHTTNDLMPRADYAMLQDQYRELEILNSRITTITRALRVVGAYDANNTELANMLTGAEFSMVAVSNWGSLSEKGGLAKAVDWFPVEQLAIVLDRLNVQRQAVVAQLYELTGISDIMRGSSNPRDTLGAQKLKAQYSSVRLRLTQADVAGFVCAAMRLRAEIMARHFTDEMLLRVSQIERSYSDPQLVSAAIQLLRNPQEFEFRVAVTEESLSMADYTAEREMRVAYITAVGQFLSQSAQMVASMPAALPYIIEIIKWVTSSFRGSDDIETVLDKAAQAAQSAPPQGQGQPGQTQKPPAPDPEVVEGARARADIMVNKSKIQDQIRYEVVKSNLSLRNDLIKSRQENENGQQRDVLGAALARGTDSEGGGGKEDA
jgi:hypothetical protein